MGSGTCILNISSSDDEEDDVSLMKASSVPTIPSQKRGFVLMLSNEDDDVVVIDKLPCIEGRMKENRSVRVQPDKIFLQNEASDDDCRILEGNPEKSSTMTNIHVDDTDDLLVTGENGPVACRDFPHARHLCAKFPFTTTSHDKFCEQCHCYVCDKLAPCLFWCKGRENNDGHCNASDKEEKWKALRKVFMSSQTLLRQITKSLQPLPTQQLSAVSDHQHLNVRPSRRLSHHSRSSILRRADRAAVSSSVLPRSQNPAFISHASSGRRFSLTSIPRSAETNDLRGVRNSHVLPLSFSSQLPQSTVNQDLISTSTGGIESLFTAGIAPTSNRSWSNSLSATSTGRTISQNCNSAVLVGNAEMLRGCTTRSSMGVNNQQHLDHLAFDFSRSSQPSINALMSWDLVGGQGNDFPLSSLPNPPRDVGDVEPLTLRDYLYSLHRERDQSSLLQLNLAEGQLTVQEEDARMLNQLMPMHAQVSSLYQENTMLSGGELQENHHANTQESSTAQGRTPVEPLLLQTLPYGNTEHNSETSLLAVASEPERENEAAVSRSPAVGNLGIHNLQLNPVFEVLPPGQDSSLQSQQNGGGTGVQTPAAQYMDPSLSMLDILADFNAYDTWGDPYAAAYNF